MSGFRFTQGSVYRTVKSVWFCQVFGLLRVQFRQVSLYNVLITNELNNLYIYYEIMRGDFEPLHFSSASIPCQEDEMHKNAMGIEFASLYDCSILFLNCSCGSLCFFHFIIQFLNPLKNVKFELKGLHFFIVVCCLWSMLEHISMFKHRSRVSMFGLSTWIYWDL